jgi:predicted extracellular nuclease
MNAAESLAGMLQEAKNNGFKFVITGNVNEFRYKTGIEGEPAVSVTVLIYDSESGEVIWSSTGSATGWSNQSRTTVAQKLFNGMKY